MFLLGSERDGRVKRKQERKDLSFGEAWLDGWAREGKVRGRSEDARKEGMWHASFDEHYLID